MAFETVRDMLIAHEHGGKTRQTKFPKGMGKLTICRRCNNFTGDQYGYAFAEWTAQAKRIVDRSPPAQPIIVPFQIMPLRVLKQITTMALAATSFTPGRHRTLRQFALWPNMPNPPTNYRFYAYFNPDGYRLCDVVGVADAATHWGPTLVIAEIAFPPLGYVVTADGDRADNLAGRKELCDISFFGRHGPYDLTTVFLGMPTKKIEGPMPLSYGR